MTRELRELGEELPYTPPRAERVQEIRDALADLPPPSQQSSPRRPLIAFTAAAFTLAAAGVAALFIFAPARQNIPPPQQPERATIHAVSGARFLHTARKDDVPERVKLSHGTVQIRVDREPLTIQTADAELKVISSLVDVTAIDEKIEFIEVFEGVVELRRQGELPVVLRAGSAWHRPIEQVEQVEPAPPPTAKQKPQPRALHEESFRDAWAAFARADYDRAAILFEKAQSAPALAEDAAYGRALALDKGGHRNRAITEMFRFLKIYPTSARADEVAVSLGWLLLAEGRSTEAKTYFERAANSSVERIRESAARGLEQIN